MKAGKTLAVGPQIRQSDRRRKTILPMLAIVVLLAIAGLQAATQYFAYSFSYHPSLGGSIQRIYAPWSIIEWGTKWSEKYPVELMQAGGVGVFITTLGLIGLAIFKLAGSNKAKASQYLHGSARWADKKDITAAGLLPATQGNAVYVGGWQDKKGQFHYLRHTGPEHILTYAPTRSGKGVGLVIPTLLSWSASCVITDLKGELWALTAGWRQQHANNKVLRFEPADPTGSVRWNPLDEIRMDSEYEVADVQNLANLIVDPDGKGLHSHWQKTSFSLFVGLILHALYKQQNEGIPATLPAIDKMLADPNRDVAELWLEMMNYHHHPDENHPVVGAAARDMLDRPEEEAGSVLSTAKSYLALYRDPVVAHNVSASDFSVKDLMNYVDPVSLYIVTQPNDKARLRPLVRVMVTMVVRKLADKMDFEKGRPKARYKHRLLMMLDEFPTLGKLEILQESLAFVAGYGIKCYLICQDINQLKSRENGYGPDESITSNCHVQNAFPPNRMETAEHLSRLTGQSTVVKEQITTSGRRTAIMLGQVSRTFQEVQRPLLTPDECMRMPGPAKTGGNDEISKPGDMVVYITGYPAIYGKQPLYFKDPVFQVRAEVPAPPTSDRLNAVLEDDEKIAI